MWNPQGINTKFLKNEKITGEKVDEYSPNISFQGQVIIPVSEYAKYITASSSDFQNWFLFYPKPHSVSFSNSDNAISAYNDCIAVIDACMDPFFKWLIEIPEMCTQMHTGWELSISYLL